MAKTWPDVNNPRTWSGTTTSQTHNHYIRCPQCERLERELAEARAMLRDIAQSGVEHITPGYIVVQIDRAIWDALKAQRGQP